MGTEIIVALIGLAGGLLTAGLGFYQWRKSHQAATAPGPPPPGKLSRSEEKALGRRRSGLLDRLTDDMRHINLLNHPKPLNIESLYVQLRVHDQQPLRFMHHEELQELRGRAPGDLVRLTRARKKDQQAEILTPEEAFTRFRRMVVLGDPGAGKTTMLRYLGFKAATDEILPVFVELRRLVRAEGGLLDYVSTRWAERYGELQAADLIDHALTTGSAVLLIDGLDEVLGGESADEADATYQRVIQEIDRLAARYPGARIAVTCRRAGWRGQLPAFRTLEVLDFDDSQIEEFVGNWFQDDHDKRDKLTAALRRSSRIQTLSANPLLLSLIAIVFESDLELPERRSKLYARTIEVLLTEWDSKRDIKRFPRFTADRKRDLLEEIAWHYQRAGLAYFAKDELLGVIAGFLPTVDLDPADAPAILGEICEHYGMLKEQAQEVYGFLHLTIQEYFAAEVAARIGAPAIAEIAKVRHDPWWEEVILLLAGRLHDATPLLLAVLGHDQDTAAIEGPVARDDDMFHNDLLLAGRCLVSTPRIKAAWLRGRIVEEIGELMLAAPDESATELFKEIGATRISQIEPRLKDLDPSHRKAVAKTLGLADLSTPPDFLKDWTEVPHEPALIVEWLERLTPHATHPDSEKPLELLVDKARELEVHAAVPVLWKLHDLGREDSRADHALNDCRHALLELGEITEDELWEALSLGWRDFGLVSLLLRVSDQDRWLCALLDPRTDPWHLRRFTTNLRGDLPKALVGSVAGHLRDESIAWPTRWLLTELLDGGPELLDVLADERAHPMVRVGAAATLADHGHHEGVPLLLAMVPRGIDGTPRSAYPGHRVAVLQHETALRERVYTCLAKTGDPAAIQALVSRFDQLAAESPPTPDDPRVPDECNDLVDALTETAPELISRRLVTLIEGLPRITGELYYRSVVSNLAIALPASLTAEMLRRVRAVNLPRWAIDDTRVLTTRIGEVGEDWRPCTSS
ncbi:NACHT domain-containing protein [Nonomuraea sp. NPDC059007]|uniref:NACHT domain-containing protein n=1 Tax=Nonomuraea sp. NPDC059007 TaxID=3346692 RepID=UPI0036CB4C4E